MSEDPEQKLKSALWLHLGLLVDTACLDLHTPNATPQFIAALTQLVYAQLGGCAVDLEAFAR